MIWKILTRLPGPLESVLLVRAVDSKEFIKFCGLHAESLWL
jgi:hypothetical protein